VPLWTVTAVAIRMPDLSACTVNALIGRPAYGNAKNRMMITISGGSARSASAKKTIAQLTTRIWSERTIAMLCGPGGFMGSAATHLAAKGVPPESIYLSMERNMQCAVGHCGHCQLGAHFVCKDGPIFPWPEVAELMRVKGY
jgi:NAD(P)H-flavin reductase